MLLGRKRVQIKRARVSLNKNDRGADWSGEWKGGNMFRGRGHGGIGVRFKIKYPKIPSSPCAAQHDPKSEVDVRARLRIDERLRPRLV